LAVPPDATVIDGSGCLVLRGLVDAHAHIDKTLWGTPWHAHDAGPALLDKIRREREVLRTRGLSPAEQGARLLQRMVACGTTHCRKHVDIDPMGLDRDPKGQLDGLFAIPGRHGCALTIHLHDRGELGAVTLEMIADRSAALGLRWRVAISHAFCLGSVEPARLDGLIERLLQEDIAIMTHAPSGTTPFPPLKLLHLDQDGDKLRAVLERMHHNLAKQRRLACCRSRRQ
jgi:hypothetical protein